MFTRALVACAAVIGFASTSLAGVNDLASWSLRFPEKVDHNRALTGCYGTASYNYVLPTVEYVKAFRETLSGKAGELTGFAFTREENQSHEPLVVNLQTGDVASIPFGSPDDEGVVFCLCRTDWTQSRHSDGRPNCSASRALPPLGDTFIAALDDQNDGDDNDGNQPQPVDKWTDRVTGWEWSYVSPAATWGEARTLCGANLPEYNIISHAAHRLWASPLGTRIHDANSNKVWSASEFDFFSAMFVYIPEGDAAATNKAALFPVLCVDRGQH